MNYIDIILLLLLSFSAIIGFRNGFVVEAASLAALILGIWGAIEFSNITSGFLIETFNMKSGYINIISFILTFLIIVILIHIVGRVVKKFVRIILPGIIDHLAGLIFGIVKSALILGVFLIVIDKIDVHSRVLPKDAKIKSRLYEPVRSLGPSIFHFLNVWDNRGNFSDSGNN